MCYDATTFVAALSAIDEALVCATNTGGAFFIGHVQNKRGRSKEQETNGVEAAARLRLCRQKGLSSLAYASQRQRPPKELSPSSV